MTREKLLKIAKPSQPLHIDKIKTIIKGNATVFRKVIKFPDGLTGGDIVGKSGDKDDPLGLMYACGIKRPPCNKGDILYIKEPWCQYSKLDDYDQVIEDTEKYYYRADGENPTPFNTFLIPKDGYDEYLYYPIWKSSIHMPKEVARVFIYIKDVNVERLQNITDDQAKLEGVIKDPYDYQPNVWYEQRKEFVCHYEKAQFAGWWETTIKRSDRDKYGWDANPWVWVIEFERIEIDG